MSLPKEAGDYGTNLYAAWVSTMGCQMGHSWCLIRKSLARNKLCA